MVKPSPWTLGVLVLSFAFPARLQAQEEPLPAPSLAPAEAPEAELAASAGVAETTGPAPGVPTISLAQAMQIALEKNFGLLGARDGVFVSRLQETVARAQFIPRLVPRYARGEQESIFAMDATQRLPWTGGSLTGGVAFRSTPDDLSPLPRTSDLRLTLSQPLLRGFGPNAAFNDLRNSKRARVGQERQYTLAQQRLAVEVARTFFNVLQQRQLLSVSRQSLRRSDSLRKASEARLQVGLVSKLDVFRAELQASQTEDSALRAEAGLQGAKEQLRFLLGLAPTDPVEPADVQLPEPETDDLETLDVLIARASAQRIDLLETRDQVEDSRRGASLARQNLLPQLDVNVAYTQIGSAPSFGSALRAGDRHVGVFLSTSYPLERRAESAGRAVAELNVAARTRTLQQRELEVQTEVRSAVREIERIRKSIELQKKGVEIAEQQRRLATLRYQRGLASNFDVVDAEGSLVLARSALVGLLSSYQVARIDLMRVTGTLDVAREFGVGAPAPSAEKP